ncbi:hypothetical protein [Sphingomonas sp. SRS2]|uniref:hypothetical protein n=1 Tax=Sphingomonas sp. SRS2 TaxID=133190 RepID=UPI000618401D|nr:hypothetical protein [Sphingomonas sp. SRS2]KKC27574.1 hypothetical protein WP12_02475 [Sphingomonas sp. SRS2]
MTSISQDDILAMLADELDAARAQLEVLGIALAGDETVAARHMTGLQALDHVGQRCASVAAILRADDLHAASHAASLESIPARLATLGSRRH